MARLLATWWCTSVITSKRTVMNSVSTCGTQQGTVLRNKTKQKWNKESAHGRVGESSERKYAAWSHVIYTRAILRKSAIFPLHLLQLLKLFLWHYLLNEQLAEQGQLPQVSAVLTIPHHGMAGRLWGPTWERFSMDFYIDEPSRPLLGQTAMGQEDIHLGSHQIHTEKLLALAQWF